MTANLAGLVLTIALSANAGPANDKPAAAGTTAASATATTTTATAAETGLGELVTNRLDFTESTEVVGKGVAQLETGIAEEGDGEGSARMRGLTTPQALLRIGFSPCAELRLGTDGFVSETAGVGAGAVRTNGGADFEVMGGCLVAARTTFRLTSRIKEAAQSLSNGASQQGRPSRNRVPDQHPRAERGRRGRAGRGRGHGLRGGRRRGQEPRAAVGAGNCRTRRR